MSTVPSLAISGCFSSSASHHSFARRVCSLSVPSSHWFPELSPVTQPMNGYARSCSLHQLLNQLSTGPAQVEITEQAIVYIKSHRCLASASHVRAKRQPLSQETFAAPVP